MMCKQVWIDTDLSVGMKRESGAGYCDVDDGYAILQLMKSDKISIEGISAVFGNTTIDKAYALCQKMKNEFSGEDIPVHRGAGGAIDLQQTGTNEAVEALAERLQNQKLYILAIGPAINIGLLLLNYPELKSQIEQIILVAGRRKPTDYFAIGNKGRRSKDANFDHDPNAFRLMFQYELPVVLCPFEISHKVWLAADDLDRLAEGDAGDQWLAEHSGNWLQQWIDQGAKGFNPFDVLASHYLIEKDDIISEHLQARLEIHPDDTKSDDDQAYKPYLLCDDKAGFPVEYCYDVVDGYHEKLMRSLVESERTQLENGNDFEKNL